jgi:hypothetical protein
VSGIVYSPVLACADGSEANFAGSGFVGKAIPEAGLVSEMQHAATLRALGMGPLHSCELRKLQTNANFLKNRNDESNVYENNEELYGTRKYYTHQVIYPNGGQSVYAALQNRKQHFAIFRALKEFIPKLLEFNRNYIHFDLHLENLVFDGRQIRMIDFEKMRPVLPEYTHIDVCNILLNVYALLKRYTDNSACGDPTYAAWLAANAKFSDYQQCINSNLETIVGAINTIPTVKAPSRCTIMG